MLLEYSRRERRGRPRPVAPGAARPRHAIRRGCGPCGSAARPSVPGVARGRLRGATQPREADDERARRVHRPRTRPLLGCAGNEEQDAGRNRSRSHGGADSHARPFPAVDPAAVLGCSDHPQRGRCQRRSVCAARKVRIHVREPLVRPEGEGLRDAGRVPGRGGRVDPLPGRKPPRFDGVPRLSEAGAFDRRRRRLPRVVRSVGGWRATPASPKAGRSSRATTRVAAPQVRMRDVIVIGAGAGGPVVAKELAARGLDVLLLEAGPRFARSERDWSHLENEASNPPRESFASDPATAPSRRGRATSRRTPSCGRRQASAARRFTTSATRRVRCLARSPTTTAPTRMPTTARTSSHSGTASSFRTTSGWSTHCRCRPLRWGRRRCGSSRPQRRSASRSRPRRTSPGPRFARRRTPSSSQREPRVARTTARS